MKICIFYSSPLTGWGGGTQVSFRLANLLSENRHRVTLWCYPVESEARLENLTHMDEYDPRYNFEHGKLFKYKIIPVSKINLTKKTSLIDYTSEDFNNYDLYIINGIPIRSFLPLALHKIFRKYPCIFRFNSRSILYPCYASGREQILYYLYHYFYMPRFIKSSDAVWVLNETDKIYFRMLSKNVYKILNYVDLDLFYPKNKKDRFTVLFVGRFTYEKGMDTLFKSIHSVNRSNTEIDFIFIGSGAQQYEKQIDMLKSMYQNIYWEKPLFGRILADYYATSQITVIPSILEGLPNVALESLSSGTPVISSAIPGLVDIIVPRKNNFENIHNCTGSFFPVNNSQALSNEIIAWYNLWKERRHQYERICRNACNYAIQNLTKTRFLNDIEKMIQEVIQVTTRPSYTQ